jgi:hypothetical protein
MLGNGWTVDVIAHILKNMEIIWHPVWHLMNYLIYTQKI